MRFTFNPLDNAATGADPDTRAAATIAAANAAFSAASADVNQENLAEEGLTSRSFETDVHVERLGSTLLETPATFSDPFAGSFATLLLGGSPLQVALSDLADGSVLRVVAAVWVSDVDITGSGTLQLDMRIDRVVSGVGTKVPGSGWRDWKTSNFPLGMYATAVIETWIYGPVSGLQAVRLLHLAAETGTASAWEYTISRALLVVDEFKRFGSL